MLLGSGPSRVPLGKLKGMPLQAIEVYQTEEALNLDIRLQDGHVLDLVFRVGFQAIGTVLKWENGNSKVVRRITPQRSAVKSRKSARTPEVSNALLSDLRKAS